VDETAYLAADGPRPRHSSQIVLSGPFLGYASRVRWSLAKTDDTPVSIRDVPQDVISLSPKLT